MKQYETFAKVFIVSEVQGAPKPINIGGEAEIVWFIQRSCEHRATQQLAARNIFAKVSS